MVSDAMSIVRKHNRNFRRAANVHRSEHNHYSPMIVDFLNFRLHYCSRFSVQGIVEFIL